MTLTIITPAWTTDRGTDVPDWDNATTTEEEDWRVQPMSAAEITEAGRQGVIDLRRGFGPKETVLDERCRATIDGETFEVDGAIKRYESISGGLAHSEVLFKRVEG